ncbi:DUF2867 domain-containing protein [Nocardioides dongkuii]|uniref:DUF2867 domain-containing protein n=1 Tax=Nocardioides dongkuii TaxID=2760089 RepID=UPI001877F8F6|nr:DUF2867 domain-containing protein [Nocardioides dongkuii]
MRRRPALRSSTRSSEVPVAASAAWRVVASGQDRPQWYADATPFVVRAGVDRALGGAGRRWRPPGKPVLTTGDRAGFWVVEEADHDARRLVLRADVRAPGEVRLEASVTPLAEDRCRITLRVSFAPAGVLGRAYLVTDLAAREVVTELAQRRLLADVRRGT